MPHITKKDKTISIVIKTALSVFLFAIFTCIECVKYRNRFCFYCY